MPFVSDDVQPGRKRRWNGQDDRVMYNLYPTDESKDFYRLNNTSDLAPRKIIPLSKRARISDNDIHIHDELDTTSPVNCSHRRRRSSQLKAPQVQPILMTPRKAAPNLLAPCHICHRKPTKKSDLDSFAECQGCGERACFVCIRECQGWNMDHSSVLSEQEVLSRSFHMDDVNYEHNNTPNKERETTNKGWAAGGHRAVVCSRCCIERGAEGDVTCLGCFSRMEAS